MSCSHRCVLILMLFFKALAKECDILIKQEKKKNNPQAFQTQTREKELKSYMIFLVYSVQGNQFQQNLFLPGLIFLNIRSDVLKFHLAKAELNVLAQKKKELCWFGLKCLCICAKHKIFIHKTSLAQLLTISLKCDMNHAL